jgi:hypothetical protein
MLTDNRADYRTQDWFLIACDGDLVLKLARDLMIGEDERGQTVLSPARDDALLRVTSEHGCLTLQAMAMDWTFSEEGGLGLQHLTFVEGLTLKLIFPASSLILTPDFQAGGATVDREIRLMPTKTPALTLSRVNEPVILIEPALLPAPEAANGELLEDLEIEEATEQAKATEALTKWDHHEIPDEEPENPPAEVPSAVETAAAAEDQISVDQISADQNAPPEQIESSDQPVFSDQSVETTGPFEALPSLQPSSPRTTHRPLASLMAAAALLTPMYLFLADGHKLGVDFPLTNYRPLSESVQPPTPAQGTVERTQAPDRRSALAENNIAIPAPTPDRAEPAAPAAPAANNQEQLLIASLLAEAKAYYDAGLIVTPIEANTVSHLTQVLSMDPTNEAGLQLMYLSAVTLIEEAQAAHAAGDNYLARNLVEDVLGFHPEFDDARALLDSWSRVPES